ncbi:uncharacterized protein M6B38_384275 [Iris pallida]|uniref:Reverse transcriptase zinc-binding domain-containing protein n=1 Tax=Iris pallida TaxID=29817 RepID=A0AAX6G3K1_IRIPA|nr:uncharacterized protein M6B38_384275 [Iris pallida]
MCVKEFGEAAATAIRVSGMVISDSPDSFDWRPGPNGHFTLESTWQVARIVCFRDVAAYQVWSPCITLKWSILVWRVLQDKLPTDEAIKRIGFHNVSKCYCCIASTEESIGHILYQGETTVKVWAEFEGRMAIHLRSSRLMDRLCSWWSGPNAHLRQVLIAVIIWVLWKNRNKAIYEENKAILKSL